MNNEAARFRLSPLCVCVRYAVFKPVPLARSQVNELRLQLNYRVCDAQHIPLCFGAFNFVAERGPLSPNSGVCGKLRKVCVDR